MESMLHPRGGPTPKPWQEDVQRHDYDQRAQENGVTWGRGGTQFTIICGKKECEGTRVTHLCSARSHHPGLPYYIHCKDHTYSQYESNLKQAGKSMEEEEDVDALRRSIDYLSERLSTLGVHGSFVSTTDATDD